MSSPSRISHEVALGAVVNAAVVSSWLGALVIWSRYCDAHKRGA